MVGEPVSESAVDPVADCVEDGVEDVRASEFLGVEDPPGVALKGKSACVAMHLPLRVCEDLPDAAGLSVAALCPGM
jgi:hypothetical protein